MQVCSAVFSLKKPLSTRGSCTGKDLRVTLNWLFAVRQMDDLAEFTDLSDLQLLDRFLTVDNRLGIPATLHRIRCVMSDHT